MNSIYFIVKSEVNEDKHKLLELFFKDWIDTSCNNEVQYRIEQMRNILVKPGVYLPSSPTYKRFRVDFEKQEDALALRLRGVPNEFQNYLEIVN